MEQINFRYRCILRIWGCLSLAMASVLINGAPMREVPIENGVRQGDPFFLFLFILEMEGMNISMKMAYNKSIFHGVEIPNCGLIISHFFYADDATLIGNWSRFNIKNIAQILWCFQIGMALKVNFQKS